MMDSKIKKESQDLETKELINSFSINKTFAVKKIHNFKTTTDIYIINTNSNHFKKIAYKLGVRLGSSLGREYVKKGKKFYRINRAYIKEIKATAGDYHRIINHPDYNHRKGRTVTVTPLIKEAINLFCDACKKCFKESNKLNYYDVIYLRSTILSEILEFYKNSIEYEKIRKHLKGLIVIYSEHLTNPSVIKNKAEYHIEKLQVALRAEKISKLKDRRGYDDSQIHHCLRTIQGVHCRHLERLYNRLTIEGKNYIQFLLNTEIKPLCNYIYQKIALNLGSKTHFDFFTMIKKFLPILFNAKWRFKYYNDSKLKPYVVDHIDINPTFLIC